MPGNNTSEKLDLLDMVGSRPGCEREECVCEGVLGVPLCLCFMLLILTPSSGGKKQRDQVRVWVMSFSEDSMRKSRAM